MFYCAIFLSCGSKQIIYGIFVCDCYITKYSWNNFSFSYISVGLHAILMYYKPVFSALSKVMIIIITIIMVVSFIFYNNGFCCDNTVHRATVL
uniref:Uncharacterized protein n=1 Tax=Octopus bimaculoides TaxID=37653 RepID=A0A0L8HQB9_OCTBM